MTALLIASLGLLSQSPDVVWMDADNKPYPVADRRAETYRDSYTYHTFPVYASRQDWEKRAEEIRLRMRIAGGLMPMPERTPLNARVFDEVFQADYVVAKVTFESRPGLIVTGNLYTPKGAGPFPAVLCPHGHWKAGRPEDSEKASVPARCITFARMGMAAFSYDMIGFQDSKPFPHEFEEPQGKLWAMDTFALQLWNSIRAVDFVQSLPRVEYPAVRSIYKLYDAPDKIESVQFDAGHNYNKASREAVYRFFGKWLLGQGQKYRDFVEPPYTADPPDTMRIFPGDQAPTGYPSKEEIVKRAIEAARARWKAELPMDPAGAQRFRDLYAPALFDRALERLYTPFNPRYPGET